MRKMKEATELTYIDGTFFETEVFMASKVSNLITLVVTRVRTQNVAHSLKGICCIPNSSAAKAQEECSCGMSITKLQPCKGARV
jgi:hypothetical protein